MTSNHNSTQNTTPTLELAKFVHNLKFSDLPPEVVSKAKEVFADAIGCAIAALSLEPRKAGVAHAMASELNPVGEASIIGAGSSHPSVAALANGILINATDNDDTHKRALIHVGSVLIPAALACCEAKKLSGKDLITAIVAGYEVCVRVGMAVMPTHYRFWHSTATNGHFAAAAAAAKAYGLDVEKIVRAFGYAGTQAAGLNTFFESGDDSKSVHPGKAGMNGILGALLAEKGATSPPEILAHPKGYLNAYSLEPKLDQLTQGLGSTWEILQNGIKYYPTILASHSPIGATLEIVSKNNFEAKDIKSVEVHTYATVKSHFSSKDVKTEMAARLSVPFCVAIALVDKTITQVQFTAENIRKSDVQNVLNVTEIIADPELTKLYPHKFPARVVVTLNNGQVFEARHDYPKGDPDNPLSSEEFLEKFEKNVSGSLSADKAKELFSLISKLDEIEVSALSPLLRKAS